MRKPNMVLQIYTLHQIHLVMQMNYYMKKKRFPPLVLIKIDDLIIGKKVDSENVAFLITEPIRRDPNEIFEMFNIKQEDLDQRYENIFQVIKKKKKRVWFLMEIRLVTSKSIFVIYSRRKKDVLREEG